MNYAASYAARQRDPRKHLAGLGAVIVFHALLVYALANGLGRKVVEVLKSPLQVSVIEEIKPPPPPPPPPRVVTPRPKQPPPPAYAPPVEVAAPTPQVAVITTTSTPPPEPTPAPVVAPAPPAAPPAVKVALACPNHQSIPIDMPKQAVRMGLSGQVLVEFIVNAAGEVKEVGIAQSSNAIFNQAALNAVAQYRCIGQGRDVRVRVPFAFRVES